MARILLVSQERMGRPGNRFRTYPAYTDIHLVSQAVEYETSERPVVPPRSPPGVPASSVGIVSLMFMSVMLQARCVIDEAPPRFDAKPTPEISSLRLPRPFHIDWGRSTRRQRMCSSRFRDSQYRAE